MANYRVKIDLLKIRGAFKSQYMTADNQAVNCVVIPLNADGVFESKAGCYLNMMAFELKAPKFEDTHCIKPYLDTAAREKLTEEERQSIPILGGLHESIYNNDNKMQAHPQGRILQPQAGNVMQPQAGAPTNGAPAQQDLPF